MPNGEAMSKLYAEIDGFDPDDADSWTVTLDEDEDEDEDGDPISEIGPEDGDLVHVED